MNRSVGYIRALSAMVLIAVFMTACSLDKEGLEELSRTKNGHAKLAAIMADTNRPEQLRADAATILVRKGSLKELMAGIDQLKGKAKEWMVQSLASNVLIYIEKEKFKDMRMRAFELAYYLLEYVDLIPEKATAANRTTRSKFVGNVVNEAMAKLKATPNEMVKTETLKKVLVAAALKTPELALGEIDTFLNQTAPNLQSFLYVNHVLNQLKRADVKTKQAGFLLRWAKKDYPNVPKELAEELYANRNETLLRFLLDAARDQRVPYETRHLGLKSAMILKQKALEGLFLLLRTDDPKNDNTQRFNALVLIWDYGGAQMLEKALQSLPATGTWWPRDTLFRKRVGEFCDAKLQNDAQAIRPILERLIDDPNWVTRVYAMECMIRLYDDAVTALEPLQTDDTPLKGWVKGGETTVGEYVSSLSVE